MVRPRSIVQRVGKSYRLGRKIMPTLANALLGWPTRRLNLMEQLAAKYQLTEGIRFMIATSVVLRVCM